MRANDERVDLWADEQRSAENWHDARIAAVRVTVDVMLGCLVRCARPPSIRCCRDDRCHALPNIMRHIDLTKIAAQSVENVANEIAGSISTK